MKTRIIVDSTADLVAEVKERVHLVPLSVIFGEDVYLDGVTIDHKTFYEKLVESDVLPTTSQATPDAFMREMEKAQEAGESAVVITVASQFSGTYQSACIAAEEFPGKVRVVDSKSVAIGSAILAEFALSLLEKSLSAEEIEAELIKNRDDIIIVALSILLNISKKAADFPKPQPSPEAFLI